MTFQELLARDNAVLLNYVGSTAFISGKKLTRRPILLYSCDTAQNIDVQTGVSYTERRISAVVSFSALSAANVPFIQKDDYTISGYFIEFQEVNGLKKYKIDQSRPDLRAQNFSFTCTVISADKATSKSNTPNNKKTLYKKETPKEETVCNSNKGGNYEYDTENKI